MRLDTRPISVIVGAVFRRAAWLLDRVGIPCKHTLDKPTLLESGTLLGLSVLLWKDLWPHLEL